jgi:hypothetical protein
MDEHLLRITVTEEGATPAELDNLTASLRRVLDQTTVNSITRAPAEAPAGSKGPAVELATLLVSVFPPVLGSVVGAVVGWLLGHSGRSVTLSIGDDSIVVTQLKAKEQHTLVETWLRRHSDGHT